MLCFFLKEPPGTNADAQVQVQTGQGFESMGGRGRKTMMVPRTPCMFLS